MLFGPVEKQPARVVATAQQSDQQGSVKRQDNTCSSAAALMGVRGELPVDMKKEVFIELAVLVFFVARVY